MKPRPLGKKQHEDNDYWMQLWVNIRSIITRSQIDLLVSQTLREMEPVLSGKAGFPAERVGYAWSGGKDSQVIRGLCEHLGVKDCVMGMCNLEYPAFLRWVTDVMPWGLEVINTGQDLTWLSEHPEMLFPQDATTAGKWFKSVQHTAQKIYFRTRKMDILILGRRKQDGNFTGQDGLYRNREGIVRYSPIRGWTHEACMAYLRYYDLPIPPIYAWPNGWVVGTGAWAARQWTTSIEQGWKEVYLIDRSIVEEAATVIPSARSYLDQKRQLTERQYKDLYHGRWFSGEKP